MDETINVILKLQFDFALEVWFSKFLRLCMSVKSLLDNLGFGHV